MAMLRKESDISWIHRLWIDIEQQQEVDVNDDLARELSLYTQPLAGTRQAFGKFQSVGINLLRPADYYAEMMKTDAHVVKVKVKVKGRLLAEKKSKRRKRSRQ